MVKEINENKEDRFENLPCDYGWVINESWNGITLPKKDTKGVPLTCGMYVRNKVVSGRIVFYETSCEFRVQVLGCRFPKDRNSITFYYPTPLGREEVTTWEVYDSSVPLEEWLNTFPPIVISKGNKDE